MVDDLYTNDPEFIATPLNSPHPPPRIHSTQRGTPSGIREQQPRPKLTPLPASPARPGFRTDKVIPSQQTPQWLSCNEEPEAGGWLEKLSVVVEQARPIDHSLFCDKEIVDDLISTKLRIGAVAPSDLYRARTLANPYESIGRSIFVNRSAVKMANLDAMCRFRDAPIRTGSSELRFVDVCAGPGGFTEYMLWRARQRKVRARGWGMTLRGPQDFALDDIAKLEPKIRDLFVPFYGEKDTGDVYSDTHLRGFADRIRTDTDDKGVDLVMGDGGFNVDGDELNQEDHSRQLILCQIVIMFMTLRKKGDFTVKVFDTYHPFTVQLLYILYRYFDKMAIIKPFTSRPANAERYIVCHSLKVERPQNLIDHLLAVNARFNALKPDDDDATGPLVSSHAEPPPGLIPRDVRIRDGMDDVVGIMDPDVVMRDETFLTRIRSLNMR
ncbi:hypothetical protein HKX48_008944 [Thoreauomyces humboldtii]|nr:hypothetical protein HKX48_008944 [Thoreauomyces humboldtii]